MYNCRWFVQKSGKLTSMVLNIPILYDGFHHHPRWLALGFLNHQQYHGISWLHTGTYHTDLTHSDRDASCNTRILSISFLRSPNFIWNSSFNSSNLRDKHKSITLCRFFDNVKEITKKNHCKAPPNKVKVESFSNESHGVFQQNERGFPQTTILWFFD